MAWRSDSKADWKKDGTIASLRFGAERESPCRHKRSKTMVELVLQHGSLLVMKDVTRVGGICAENRNKRIS